MERGKLLAPGPVPVPEEARLEMAHTLIHHRGPAFKAIFNEVREGLQWVFETKQEVLSLTSSGTGAFEAAMINFTRRGEKIVAVGGGKFGERWGKVGRAFGLEVVDLDVAWGQALDPQALADALKAHPDCRMVTLSVSETSTGVLHPIEDIARVVRDHGEALLAADGITSIGVHPMPMDELGIDVLVGGSQKAFAVPPGLGFVAASQRAWARQPDSDHPKFYFDLKRELEKQKGGQTAFTPAISVVLALRVVLRQMREEGREALFARQAMLGAACRAAAQALGLEIFPARPSDGVTAIRLPEGVDAPSVARRMRDEHGITIAGGQAQLKPFLVRIGHMGRVFPQDLIGGLSAFEQVLRDEGVDVEPGSGVAAAQRVFASSGQQQTEK